MKLQYKILIFVLCLNLASMLVLSLNLPGTSYVSHATTEVSSENIEEQFNPEEIVGGWSAEPSYLVGDVVSAFMFFFQRFHLLIDGFPSLLDWMSHTFISDSAGQAAFNTIALTLRAVFYVLIVTMLIEFIGGRVFTD